MSTHPKITGNIFDSLHNEISDRDQMVAQLNTEVEKPRSNLLIVHTRMQAAPSEC